VFGVLFILVVLVMPGGFVEGGQKMFRFVTRRGTNQPQDNADGDSAPKERKERV
jgi:hypothetical protein